MSVAEAADILYKIMERKREESVDVCYSEDSLLVGVARVGHETQIVHPCSLSEMRSADIGQPLHSLIIPAHDLHPLELEFLQFFTENPLK